MFQLALLYVYVKIEISTPPLVDGFRMVAFP